MDRFYLLALLLFLAGPILAQPILDKPVDFSIDQLSLESALYELGKTADLNLIFSNDILPEKQITCRFVKTPLKTVLKAVLSGTSLSYRVIGQQIVLFQPEKPLRSFTVSGYIQDDRTGELLVGATVMIDQRNTGTSSNAYGFFTLEIKEDVREVTFSYLGYKRLTKQIELTKDESWTINLLPSLTLAEVIVVAKTIPTFEPEDFVDKLVSAQLETVTSLGGEGDIFRLANHLPGVTTGTDGIGGIHVRGGSLDQNLFLLDDVPIYNPTHLIGAFSIFNDSAIKSASFVRGRFPARYGGRLSSVLDIRTKDGNLNEWETSIGLGVSSAKFSVEGPLVKGKSSIFLAARTTPLGLLIKPISERNKMERNQEGSTDLLFYDVNAKLHYAFSDRNKLYLSFYQGGDAYKDETAVFYQIGEDVQLNNRDYSRDDLRWGNRAGALRWNHLISNKVFINTSLIYSQYQFNSESVAEHTDTLSSDQSVFNSYRLINFSSEIKDLGIKVDIDHSVSPLYQMRYGGEATHHRFTPGLASEEADLSLMIGEVDISRSFFDSIDNRTVPALEYALYSEHNLHWKNLDIRLGLRWSALSVEGTFYQSLQPRANFSWRPFRRVQISGGVSNNQQYLHLLSTSGVGLPTDIWIPSTDRTRPQSAWQYVLGVKTLLPNNFTLGVEAYYKKLNHLVEYSENTSFSFVNSRNYENNIVTGKGTSKGIEWMLERNLGRATTTFSYTLSATDRTFSGINNGASFPYRYDRRHNLKIGGSYRFSEQWTVVTNFEYGSGLAVSLPAGRYAYSYPGSFSQPIEVLVFEERNGFRLPPNHRMDIALNWRKAGENIEQSAGIGVYNVYNRKNVLYYRLGRNPDDPSEPAFLQASLVPILPYFQYAIKF